MGTAMSTSDLVIGLKALIKLFNVQHFLENKAAVEMWLLEFYWVANTSYSATQKFF